MSTTVDDKVKSAADLMTLNVRAFIEIKSAYEQCSPEIQAAVDDMIAIVQSENATADEKNGALLTIVEALFPRLAADYLESCEQAERSPQAVEQRAALRAEQEYFSQNIRRIMRERNLTQEALAQLAGVGQSAISNLLNRNLRPQRRTVIRIAGALGVEPRSLWPGIENVELD